MNGDGSQDQIADLIVRLKTILAALDHIGEKVAAIKVDEAIASLSDESRAARSAQDFLSQ